MKLRIPYLVFLITLVSLALSGMNIYNFNGFRLLFFHRILIVTFVIVISFSVLQKGTARVWDTTVPGFLFLGLVLVYVCLSVLNSNPRFIESITTGVQIVTMLIFYLAITNVDFSRKEFEIVLRTWVGVVIVVSIFGFYQIFAKNIGLPFGFLEFGDFKTATGALGPYLRPTSIFREPGQYSSFVLPAYIFSSVLYANRNLQKLLFGDRNLCTVLVLFLWTNFIFIASLGGFLTVVSILAVVFVLHPKTRKYVVATGTVIAVSVISINALGRMGGSLFHIVGRIDSLYAMFLNIASGNGVGSGSPSVRLIRLLWNLDIWLNHPLLGVGIDNARFFSAEFSYPRWYIGGPFSYAAHNTPVFVLTSFGTVGFSIFAWFIMNIAKAQRGLIRSRNGFQRAIGWGFSYAILAMIFTSAFQFPLHYSYQWFVFGIATVGVTVYRDDDSRRKSGAVGDS